MFWTKTLWLQAVSDMLILIFDKLSMGQTFVVCLSFHNQSYEKLWLVRMSDNISLLKRKIQNFTSYQIVPIFPFQFPPSFPLLAQIELSLQWPMSHSSGNGKLAATLLCRWSTVMVPSQHSHSINTANREEASAPKSNTLLRPLALRDTTPVCSSLCWI